MAGCRCGWLLTYTAALSKDSRHHAASTSTSFASDFRRTRRHPNQPRNFSALRRYVGRLRFFIHSRSQPNKYISSSCRFRTAHRKAPCSGLTLPWCRNAVAYIWCRRQDSNLRMRESKSLALPLGYACMVFPCRNPTGDTGRVCSRVTGTAPAYRVELALLRKEV